MKRKAIPIWIAAGILAGALIGVIVRRYVPTHFDRVEAVIVDSSVRQIGQTGGYRTAQMGVYETEYTVRYSVNGVEEEQTITRRGSKPLRPGQKVHVLVNQKNPQDVRMD